MNFNKLLLLGAFSSALMIGMSYAQAGENGSPDVINNGPVYNEDGSIFDGTTYNSGPIYNEDGSLSDGTVNHNGPREDASASNNSSNNSNVKKPNVPVPNDVKAPTTIVDKNPVEIIDYAGDRAANHMMASLGANSWAQQRAQLDAAKKSLVDRYNAALAVQPKTLADVRTKFKVLHSTKMAHNDIMNYQQTGNFNSLINALKALQGGK